MDTDFASNAFSSNLFRFARYEKQPLRRKTRYPAFLPVITFRHHTAV